MNFIKIIISLFMVIFMPILNFADSLKPVTEGSFTEPETVTKEKRVQDNAVPAENDIVLSGSGLEAALKSAAGTEDNVTIWLHSGNYIIPETVVLDGAENITLRSFPGEKATVSAGKEISGWKETAVNGVNALVTDIPDGTAFKTLFKGDELLPVTRYPESGYLTVDKNDRENALFNKDNTPWKEYGYGDVSFFAGDDLKYSSFKNLEDVQIKLMHYWFCERTTLTALEGKKISLKMPCSMKVESGDRYFLQNVFEELNAPGEWYLDTKENLLYYIPSENDDPGTLTLFAPSETKLFDLSGCKGITFKDISFKNTDWDYLTPDPSVGWLDTYGLLFPQGNLECEGVFDITKSSEINFVNCDFLNIGMGAIRFHREDKNCSVTGCTFKEIGSNAIFIDGYNTDNEDIQTENIRVYDNLINGYGRNFPSAIGVLLTHAKNCEIAHNEICDGYYTAISIGWMWGYAASITDGITVADNLIYNIGQGWLSDMGGIYTLGIQPHTVLTRNRIYNVAADPGEGGYGGWGIYLDEGSSEITVEKNLVYDCGSKCFHQHYGENNHIQNNIFALSKEGQIQTTRNEEHNEFFLTGNIIVSNDTPIYTHLEEEKFVDDGNLYWDYSNHSRIVSISGDKSSFKNLLYPAVAKMMGYYNNAVYEDPLFRDAENFDFTLADNSPAIEKIGFEPWNYNTAGTVTDFS